MSESKSALITGITGQDGSYLSELLLEKGYTVHGIIRRTSTFNTDRIDHLYTDPHDPAAKLLLHYGDLTDSMNLTRIIQECQPDEIYNLGAMSHVAVSFDTPEYVGNVDGLGTLRILEAVRILGLEKKTRIYQASTSELFGGMPENKNERGFTMKTPHYILVLLMELLKFTVFGLQKITVKRMICLLVTVFYSTTNLHVEGKLL